MGLPLYFVDAFTSEPFRGNPAAVCLLEHSVPKERMQSLAFEIGFSETAFLLSSGDELNLRWFTPKAEVDLCGHATLATAHVLLSTGRCSPEEPMAFQTRSGELRACFRDGRIEMDFPTVKAIQTEAPRGLLEAIGATAQFVGRNKDDYLILVGSEQELRSLQPDFPRLAKVDCRGIIVTCRSESSAWDFISRFFAPAVGVDEDPVTGSAHCCLGPFWSERLGRSTLNGYQASERGGSVSVRVVEDRAFLGGNAVTVLEGTIPESLLSESV